MDAVRSFRHNPGISKEILIRVLKSVAIHSLDLGYCQGMNYIAGTLYLQIQDEALTFNCMLGLLSKFSMHDLFVKDLPKLKQLFYQFDRLIGIMLPEVHRSFRSTGLSSGHFSSSWFITVFAGVFP